MIDLTELTLRIFVKRGQFYWVWRSVFVSFAAPSTFVITRESRGPCALT